MAINPTVGKNIRRFRKQMGLSQDAIASFLGTKREVVAYYELGTRDVPADQLIKLSYLFGCEVSDLLEENQEAVDVCLAFAFKANSLEDADLESIASFKKIVRNYLNLSKIDGKRLTSN